jgi:hypothetical protein
MSEAGKVRCKAMAEIPFGPQEPLRQLSKIATADDGVVGRIRSVYNPNAAPICGEVSLSASSPLDTAIPIR